VADGWCWFVLREKYYWLFVGGWFGLREKYCWLVAYKPNEQRVSSEVTTDPSGYGQAWAKRWVADIMRTS
jgi:hypothetical protein